MATPYAFVTLVTSDFYLPGALALVAALRDLHPSPPTPPEVEFQTICLVTPETVDVSSIKLLRRAFNVVIGVEIIEQEDDRKLRLLGRPDLNTVLTKLHIFRLTQYSKLIFLDADVLPLQPLSHLFTIPHEFAAVPDVGWPDIFNSGVLVVTPGEDTFKELTELQKSKGSWDGGDQGLLNEWRGPEWHRLSFVYNTTPTAAYTYAPAYERFGSGIKAIHFIGPDKPWKNVTYRSPGIKSSEATLADGTKRVYNYEALVDRWYEVYDNHYRMEPASSHEDFEVQRYSSAWDQGTSALPAASGVSVSGSGGALGLAELRRAAVEGSSSYGGRTDAAVPMSSQGEYRSMPLEGRVDLMRPRKVPEPESTAQDDGSGHSVQRGQEGDVAGTPRPMHIDMPPEDGAFRQHTLPTPAPNEMPPTPYHHGGSLPPTQTPTPYYGPSQPQSHGQNTLQVFYQPQAPGETVSEFFGSHNRPTSSQYSPPHSRQQSFHRHAPAVHEQRASYHPPESSESEATPPAPPPNPPRRTGHGTWSPQHSRGQSRHVTEDKPSGAQQKSYSPPRREEREHGHGIETPRPHYNKEHHVRLSHGQDQRLHGSHLHHHPHRGSGDRTPTQNHPRPTQGQERVAQPHSHHEQAHSPGTARHHDMHRHHQEHQTQHVPAEQQQHFEPQPAPPRPRSPPKLSWNPAVEPPPNEQPPSSTFPEDTYFPNVWDQSPSQHYDGGYPTLPSPGRNDPANVLFSPPPPPHIPEHLIREGQYANVFGATQAPESPESVSSPPAPDRNKVHAIFPWEEKPRHVPRRVFPKADSPPPVVNYIESERTSSPISTPPTQSERAAPPIRSPTSPLALPWGIGFTNAWDSVPSIQRYASKLAGSPKIFPHQYMAPVPPPREDNWREEWERQRAREMQDQHDASSMDGDDEDEDDEDEFELSEGSSKGKASRRRARAASMGSKSRKKYRSRGIQALPETSEQSVQVTIITAESAIPRTSSDAAIETDPPSLDVPTPADLSTSAPSGVGLGIRRQWATELHPALLPSAVPRELRADFEQVAGTPVVSTTTRSGVPFPSLATPSGLRSPATLGSPRTYSPPQGATPLKVITPPKVTSPPLVSSPLRGPGSPVMAPPSQTASPRPSGSPQLALRTSASPRSTISPRKMSTSSLPGSTSSRAHSPVLGRMQQSTPSPKHTRLASLQSPFSPELQRSISAESGMTPSPSATNDSLATPENTPIVARKGSRVWDPKRGVDVFKRGSEEVLARFLRMGSFDGEDNKQQTTA